MALRKFAFFMLFYFLGGCVTKTSIAYGDISRSDPVPDGYMVIGYHGKLSLLGGWGDSEDGYLVADILSPDNYVTISKEKKFLGIGSWIERCDKSGKDHFSGPIIMAMDGSPEVVEGHYLYKAIFADGMRESIDSSYKSNLSDMPASKLDVDKHCLFVGGSTYLNTRRLISNPLPISILE